MLLSGGIEHIRVIYNVSYRQASWIPAPDPVRLSRAGMVILTPLAMALAYVYGLYRERTFAESRLREDFRRCPSRFCPAFAESSR